MLLIIISSIAIVLTVISNAPQAFKVHKTKHTKDLSLPTYLIITGAVFAWVIYGLLKHDPILIFANGVVFLVVGYITLMKLKYK